MPGRWISCRETWACWVPTDWSRRILELEAWAVFFLFVWLKSNQETSGTWNRIFLEHNPVLRYIFRYIFNIKVYLLSIYKHTYQKHVIVVACVLTQKRSVCPADPISERSPQGSKLPRERSLPPQRCTPADGEVVPGAMVIYPIGSMWLAYLWQM